MGILATLAANGAFSGLGSAFLGGLTSLFGSFGQNSAQRRLMNEQMDFNSREAALNRDFQERMNLQNNMFSARQAEIARQFQEEFYNKYQSPSAMMAQYRDAGINPVLVAGQGASSPPSVSSASASSPSGGSAASASLGSAASLALVDAITSFMKIKAEIDNINADTRQKEASADKARSDISVNNQNISESQARISKIIEETKNESEKRGLIVAQKVLANIESQLKSQETVNLSYEEFKLKWEKQFADTYGAYPANNAYEAVQRLLDTVLEKSGILRIFGVDR